MAKKARRIQKDKKLKRHHWTVKQTDIYITFLREREASFKDFRTKKSARVFVCLSKIMRTRSPGQVKSHHQKLMAKWGSIPNIIASLNEEQEVFGRESSSTQNDVMTESQIASEGKTESGMQDEASKVSIPLQELNNIWVVQQSLIERNIQIQEMDDEAYRILFNAQEDDVYDYSRQMQFNFSS